MDYVCVDTELDLLLDNLVQCSEDEARRRNDAFRRNGEAARLIPMADYYHPEDVDYYLTIYTSPY